MNFDLLNGVRPLALLLVVDAALLAFLAYPLRRRYSDDQGDGLTLVLLPRPVLPSYWRVPGFAGLFLVLFIGYHSLRGADSPDQIYAEWVTRVCDSVVRSPAEISGYLDGFTLGLRFLIIGTIVCFAVAGRGNLAPAGRGHRAGGPLSGDHGLHRRHHGHGRGDHRRARWHRPRCSATSPPSRVAVLAMTRMEYANYALPKPSAVPFVRRPRLSDAWALVGVTVAAMAICMSGLLLIFHLADPAWRPALALVLPVPFAEGSFIVRSALLAVVNGFTIRPDPPVGDERPPIDVIIPAYNEADVIEETLDGHRRRRRSLRGTDSGHPHE